MTLRLAAFQHFCARFADAVLTSWSPLTYERGDYMDGTEKLDPEYWEPGCDGKCAHDECVCDALTALRERLASLASQDSGAAPPAASVTPAPVDGTPPASPGAGLSFVDYMTPAICDVLATHRFSLVNHSSIGQEDHCSCGERPRDGLDWREHVAPLIAERIERAGGKR